MSPFLHSAVCSNINGYQQSGRADECPLHEPTVRICGITAPDCAGLCGYRSRRAPPRQRAIVSFLSLLFSKLLL